MTLLPPRVAIPALLLVTIVLPAVAVAQPAETVRLEHVLPARSFGYVVAPDVTAIAKALSDSSLARIYRDEEVQEFLAPLLETVKGELRDLRQYEGVDVLKMLSCIRGEVGVGVVGMDLSRGAPYPDLVISVDTRDRREGLQALLDGLVEQIGGDNESFRSREREVGRVKVRVLEDKRTRLDTAMIGSTFLLTTKPKTMDEVIQAWSAGTETLATVPAYVESMKRVRGRGTTVIRAFVNVGKILETYKEMIGPQWSLLEETGVAGIRSIAFSTTLEGPSFTDRLHVHAPGETRGLFRLMTGKPVDRDLLRAVPKNAFHVTAGTMDLGRVYDEVLRVLATVQPGAFAAVTGQVEQIEGLLGFALRKDLLASVGHDFVLHIAAPRGGGLVPEVVLNVALKDQAEFEKCIDQALTVLSEHAGEELTREKREFRGHTIHYIRFQSPLPVIPAFTFVDGRLMVALQPQTIMGELRARASEKPRASILDEPRMKEALEALPGSACAVGLTNTESVFNVAYNTALPFLQAAKIDGPFDLALLPSAEAISRHLEVASSAVWVDDDGWTTMAKGPISAVTVMIPALSAGVFLTAAREPEMAEIEARPVPAEEVPELPAEDPDVRNLDEIGTGLLIYFVEKGKYPDSLEGLVKARCIDASSLVNPDDPSPRQVGSVKTSYEYVGDGLGMLRSGKNEVVVAWTRSPVRAVLFLDGSVRRVAEKEFQALLARTKARIAQGGK
jgi:hypothetical protein